MKTFLEYLVQIKESIEEEDNEFEDADKYAAEKHGETGAMRKLSKQPYIVHPQGVAKRLKEAGAPRHVVIAGYLHDVVEDTPTPLSEIEERFGSRVAELVKGSSEELADTGGKVKLSWDDRKSHTMHSTASINDPELMMVIIADKLDNVEDTAEHGGPDIWDKFNSEPSKYGNSSFEKQKWYYTSLADIFDEKLPDFPLTKQYRNIVNSVFGS